MSVQNLDRLFKPRHVAVVGASARPGSVGWSVLHNLISSGFEGSIFAVNPNHTTVQGLPSFARVGDLPVPPDLALICIPAAGVPDIVRECGAAGIRAVTIISAGFRETGDEGRQLEARVAAAAKEFPGLRILGPNCLGFIVPRLGLNASFASGMPGPGHIAFVSQSGALCTSALDWALDEGIGFSHFISIGNMLDVNIADLIDYLNNDASTTALILYLESITNPREFMSAARAFARRKPIVAYKSGRFAQSAKAAASHTGALAGVDAVYEAAFERAGIVRVYDVGEMFYCAELLARQRLPHAARLAIVTNAGGPGVMATDTLIDRKGHLAELSQETIEQLNVALPSYWSHGNPVDILGDATPERYARATDIVLHDRNVDAALVTLTPQAMTDSTETARQIAAVGRHHSKPLLTAWMGSRSVREGVDLLNQAGMATFGTPEEAVRAFMYLVSYARNREILYETPRDIPLSFALPREEQRQRFAELVRDEPPMLTEVASKRLLETYEIPTTLPHLARTADEAVEAARAIGYPVVLKIVSPDITHKTDVGGVVLNLLDDDQVRRAAERITQTAAERRPDARIEGVTVQRMVALQNGYEMILGAKKDPVFGAVILVGSGGVAAELFEDRALGLPPLNERLARRMLESLKAWPLLQGYRGRPPVDVDRLIELLMRFSYLIAEHPEIEELDINPLLVARDEIIALDARVLIDRELHERPGVPFSHLAIRPYPEEFVREATLKDGTRVLLRPIKPEDEPLWHELLASCSPESIWSRFRYLFKTTTHEMAARFCFTDYDRELAIVAEIEDHGERRLIGVGRLVADPEHESAEYAVLVVDAWQGRGLGGVLMAYCLEIAESWGIRRVFGETGIENRRMLATFRKFGFEFDHTLEPGVVLATRTLQPTSTAGG